MLQNRDAERAVERAVHKRQTAGIGSREARARVDPADPVASFANTVDEEIHPKELEL